MMSRIKIVLVEDEKILRVSIADTLANYGYNIIAFENGYDALNFLKQNPVELTITDIKMPGISGLALLKSINDLKIESKVIVMTAHGTIETALESIDYGAYDYIGKPFKIEELLFKIKKIEEYLNIKYENENLKQKISAVSNYTNFVGNSELSKDILKNVESVASTNSTILINGETGTGKELMANIIHNLSPRKNKPFIKVSCAILSKDVFESELFGHDKGAFTGALKDRVGRFEQVNGGTIFLDDIDDVPLEMQVKLLRVLQEREFERVGGNETIRTDFRCIASSKIDLMKLVKSGKFREDLYYRINVFPLNLPPLRERKSDIPELINYYLNYFSPNNQILLDERILQKLQNYNWPGNVRELKNITERLYLISNFSKVELKNLPEEILNYEQNIINMDVSNLSLEEKSIEFEKKLIKDAIFNTNGNKTKAAEILKIPVTTLRSKLERYSL